MIICKIIKSLFQILSIVAIVLTWTWDVKWKKIPFDIDLEVLKIIYTINLFMTIFVTLVMMTGAIKVNNINNLSCDFFLFSNYIVKWFFLRHHLQNYCVKVAMIGKFDDENVTYAF